MHYINNSKRGFTLVELLIVIVVIAILAAISIVAYNGIQDRGKRTSAQTLASQVLKKAEMWNTVQSSYASYCQFATNSLVPTGSSSGVGVGSCVAAGGAGPAEARLDNVNSIRSDAAVDENAVRYVTCSGNTGAQITWVAGGSTGTLTAGTCS